MTLKRAHLLAATALLAAAFATNALAQASAAPAKQPPPRTADGKPDLNGMWGGRGGDDDDNVEFNRIMDSRRCAPTQFECDERTNQSIDGEFTARTGMNRPLYKPEFWDRVQYLDMNTNKEDPIFACQSSGVPRVGAPARIVQNANDIIFFYRAGNGSPADYRVIPTDGRPHDPVRSLDVTFYGDSVGKWDGDVLVVDSVGLNDLTWMDKGGFFTSDQKHTIERLWREGDTLLYQVTVDDPGVLVEPWVMPARRVPLNASPKAYLPEGVPCKDYDMANMVSQIRH